MAERPHDLADLLQTAETQLEASLVATPTDDALRDARDGVRRARVRRVLVSVAGAAAAVAVVGAAVVWVPRGSAPPAGPTTEPTPVPSATATGSPAPSPEPTTPAPVPVAVAGLEPLVPATPDELRAAPVGSVLALWTATRYADYAEGTGATTETHIVLVRPDATVRYVRRAPDGAQWLESWDRTTASVAVRTSSTYPDGTAQVVDLLTGAVGGTVPVRETFGVRFSPDGVTTATVEESTLRLAGGDDVREVDLPSRWCEAVGWPDATHVLVTCTDRVGSSAVPAEADGPSLLLVDVVTGEATRRTLVTGDLVPTGAPGAALADGAVVAPVDVVGREVDEDLPRVCGTGLGRFDGLTGTPLPPVPAGDLLEPGLVAAPDRLLVGGPTSCPTDVQPSGLWSVDLTTRAVVEILPARDDLDAPYGLTSWVTWR